METHDKYRNKVWSECADDIERAEFIECGRAWETGIIARAIEGEVAEAFRFRFGRASRSARPAPRTRKPRYNPHRSGVRLKRERRGSSDSRRLL